MPAHNWIPLKPNLDLSNQGSLLELNGNILYFFGGLRGINNRISVWNLLKNDWRPCSSTFGPGIKEAACFASTGGAGFASCVYQGKAYFYGGMYEVETDDYALLSDDLFSCAMLEDAAVHWERIQAVNTAGVPGKRFGATLAAHDGHLYLFGGLDADGRVLDEFFDFDLESRTWTRLYSKGVVGRPLSV
ncbi:hypothetical protein HDU91_004078 [Kappamyces sp. JEL0680]|nr:hypothetical protein HDU91_004078 [Kappamyces sp. JEL0680]